MRAIFTGARFIQAKIAGLGRDCRGTLMVETVVAVTAFALVGTAVLAGVSTTHNTGGRVEGQSMAENLARNQMEDVFTQPANETPGAYDSIQAPQGYSVSAKSEEYLPSEPNIEKVIVTVSRDGQQLLVVETLRAKE